MYAGLLGFMKHVGFLIKLVNQFRLQNYAKHFSLAEASKSPKTKNFDMFSCIYL